MYPCSQGFPSGSVVKNLPGQCRRHGFDSWVRKILEKERATHSSILAWETPWTEEPGGLQSMGWQKKHDLVSKQQQSMFPGNSRGKNSLNIKMWIHRTHIKFRYLTIDNYHVYNFQGGGGGQGVVKLYTTTEDFLCFCLYFSSSKSSSMKYAGQGFLCFVFFFLHFTGRETWAEKKSCY